VDPTISIINRSKTISDTEIKRKLPKLQHQITHHFEPVWGWGAHLRFNAKNFDMKVIIRDRSRGDDLGYHFEGRKPVAVIFAQDDIDAQQEYTSTLSHELLEMIADPYVNLYAVGEFRFHRRKRIGFYAFEVCDPVQENYYEIDGERVQDFVFPQWFEQDRKKGSMKMDHMGTVDGPFMLADEGYIDVLSKSRWHSLVGPKGKRKRKRHRLLVRKDVVSQI